MTASKSTYKASYKHAHEGFTSATEWLSDERMSRCKILHWLSEKIDRTPSALANAALFFLLSVLALNPSGLSPILMNGLGLLPATYGSFKYLKKGGIGVEPLTPGGKRKDAERQYKETGKRWLDYWLVYSTSLIVESVVGEEIILAVVPFWWAIKGFVIIWFLVGFSSEVKKEVIKPKPLRLRPLSKIAARIQASSTPSPAIVPAPSGKGRHVNDGDDEDSSEGVTAVESDTALSTSYQERAGTLDPTLHRRLAADESIVLSATPVIPYKPRRSGARDRVQSRSDSHSESEMSSPFDLGDGSASTEGSSNDDDDDDVDSTSEESDSEEDSDTRSEEDSESDESPTDSSSIATGTESPFSVASEGSQSESSDEADNVVLPPGTPLDELALRGLKTINTPVSPAVENILEEALELGNPSRSVAQAEGQSIEANIPDEVVQGEEVDSLGGEERSSSATNSEVEVKKFDEKAGDGNNGGIRLAEHENGSPITEALPLKSVVEKDSVLDASVPKDDSLADKVHDAAEDGEVVKVSLEDLLAMDDEPLATTGPADAVSKETELMGERISPSEQEEEADGGIAPSRVTAPLQLKAKRGDRI
ncbi:hypothetical protein I316_00837 [Kwoniella heveanensis BCC8398]|uniref:Uncharacterized protein n=1 Tax=Kwoniella heveanensis BCC8398 TaxID=1296120 RepID=A0A1B9H378_9TREE|nr:hypothetical protein I316_00837 [Kwoniella heveanensis BCC8398]